MRHSFLIGNSVNRLTASAASWDDVMDRIRSKAKAQKVKKNGKPFSLHFEEIKNHWLRTPSNTMDSFREMVAQQMGELEHNSFHTRLIEMAVDNILTTNYDYCLEAAVGSQRRPANFDTQETKYSLFRRVICGDKSFWHIHGELDHPGTIMLGHDHYVESCAQIRRYTTYKDGVFYKSTGKLRQRFKASKVNLHDGRPYSWVDLLMLTNLHVIGFSMDYCETDMWYLISYKNRLQRMKRLEVVKSKIHFYGFERSDNEQIHKNIKSLLESFGVECHSYQVGAAGYRSAWEKLLKDLGRNIQKP
jgi:SIR2-like domain